MPGSARGYHPVLESSAAVPLKKYMGQFPFSLLRWKNWFGEDTCQKDLDGTGAGKRLSLEALWFSLPHLPNPQEPDNHVNMSHSPIAK